MSKAAVGLVFEFVDQPPFDTRAAIVHETIIIFDDEVAELLNRGGTRIIAATVLGESE